MIDFTPAARQKAKLRLALTGVSGAGKTLSALYLAYGMTQDWSKVALIDTEHGRGRFYACRSDLSIPTGEFLYAEMSAPFSPQKYKEYVAAAVQAVGPDGVVIIDSFSHAWNAEGGVLEEKDRIAARPGMNSYTAWNEAGRMQNNLINTILAANCHTILTMRSKMEYILQENERGKLQPVKAGLAPVQREDTEYEFDIVLELSRDHTARVSKDTTFLGETECIITPDLGAQLGAWLGEGKEPEIPLCADCGEPITPAGSFSAFGVAEWSRNKYSVPLCAECVHKRTEPAANGSAS